jgi:hypothetical protein
LHSDEAIEADPLPPGQVWAISPGGQDAAPSLYRIEATSGPGGGVKIPFTYILRNVAARRLTTVLTAGGMALVVYVFATVLMLAAGLRETLVATGQDDNVVVIRRSSQTEVQRGVDRAQAAVVETLPEIARSRTPEARLQGRWSISVLKRDSSKPRTSSSAA